MKFFLGTLFVCSLLVGSNFAQEEEDREGKKFPTSIFELVRFKNEPCEGEDKENGVCYTNEECKNKGGMNMGNCANGYGVCCVFQETCGGMTNENCTTFTSEGVNEKTTDCSLKVCPCNDNICQVRLDFTTFVITGPSTDTANVGNVNNGNLVTTNGRPSGINGNCLTDVFEVVPGDVSTPPICGINSGQHMYARTPPGGQGCIDLKVMLGKMGVGATLAKRAWSIKVTQIACDSEMRAPEGCTQYFTGLNNQVESYNLAGKYALANQNQVVCVRREANMCRICWAAAANDFKISGWDAGQGCNNNICGSYGQDGQQNDGANARAGFDFIQIPEARKITGELLAQQRFCGENGFVTQDAANVRRTVCSTSTPFTLRFVSDRWESDAENAQASDSGFKVSYQQLGTGC